MAKKDDGKKQKPSKNAPPKSAAPKGDPEVNEKLIGAAAAGDLDGVKAALAAGADIGAHTMFDGPPLCSAAASGDLAVVEFLIEKGADLAGKDGADMTALHLAARDGHLEIVKWLLERGAASSERLLRDVLTVASQSRSGKPQIVSLLQDWRLRMDRPVDLNQKAEYDEAMEKFERTKNIRPSKRVELFASKSRSGKPQIVSLLQDWRLRIVAPSTAGGSDANAKLMTAAHAGAADDVEAALKSGADVKSCDNRGLDALSWAALRGHERVVEILLKHGAAVDALNSRGWPALGQAAGQGHAGVARILITGGAKVDVVFDSGKQVTPLHVAARQGHLEVVKVLLQAGADKSRRVGAGDEEGKTARELAADQGRDDVAALLRE